MKLFEDLPSQNTPITAENLNQIQDNLVVVSQTEPTGYDREKVWIRKGKNIAPINSFSAVNTYTGLQTVRVKVNPNSSIVISATKNRIAGVGMTNHLLYGIAYLRQYNKDNQLIKEEAGGTADLSTGSWSFEWALTTLENCEYIVIDFSNNNGDGNLNTSVTNIQVEYGTQKTEFEPYVNNTISVLNKNGVYEEINNKELRAYSTEEQVIGTWIDGKPLYQKTIVLPNGTGSKNPINLMYADYGMPMLDTVFVTQPSFYSHHDVGGNVITSPFNFYDGSTYKVEAYQFMLIITATYEPIATSKMVITLNYTKTTE